MPKLVDASALGAMPSARSGRTIASFDTTAPFEATARAATAAASSALSRGQVFSGIGDTIANAGSAITADWQKVNDYATESQFQQFKTAEADNYNQASRNVQPGDAQGFADSYAAGYKDRAQTFFKTVPDRLKPQYDLKLLELQNGVHTDALTFEQGEQRRFALNSLGDTVSNALLPRIEMAAKLPEGDPNKAKTLSAVQDDGLKLIDANPALTPIEKDDAKRKLREILQTSFAKALPASERVNLDPNQGQQTIGERIIEAESGGDPTITNPNSTATGAGQFTEGTWLQLIAKNRPDLVQGKSKAQILALRNDPAISKEMVDKNAEENGQYLGARGYGSTPGNLYLAHFLGPQGAVAMLGSDPEQSAASIAPAAAKANPTIFYHTDASGKLDFNSPKTIGEVRQWSDGKMAGSVHTDWSRTLDAVPYENKVAIAVDGGSDLLRQQTAAKAQAKQIYDAQLNAFQNAIEDGKAGVADIAAAYNSGNGWLTDATDRAALVKQVEERDKAGINLAGATALVAGNQPINPFDTQTQNAVDLFYEKGLPAGGAGLLQGDAQAVQTLRSVVTRTDMVPKAAVNVIRSGMWSADPQQRDQAFTILDGLNRANPGAVSRALNEGDMKRLQDYQALAPILPPDELAKRMDPNIDPQTKKLRDGLREDGVKILNKEVSDGSDYLPSVLSAFNQGAIANTINWTSAPVAPLDPMATQALRNDYENLFAERYAVSGNEDTAKAQALQRLRLKWGVTEIGSGVHLMARPPEQFFPAIDGGHDWMDAQVDEAAAKAYPRAESWAPIVLPSTEGAIGTRQTPTYGIGVIDKDGAFQVMLPPKNAKPGWPFDYNKAHAARLQTFKQQNTPLPSFTDPSVVPIQ